MRTPELTMYEVQFAFHICNLVPAKLQRKSKYFMGRI